MLTELIQVLWVLLPAGFANLGAVLFNKVNFLNYPLDFGLKFGKKRLLGSHKTWRGLFFGVLLAIIVVFVQRLLYPYMKEYALIDYSSICVLGLGLLLGFAALFGDSVKSFLKRRIKIKPGDDWVPFDQIDWIVMAMIFSSFYVLWTWERIILAIAFYGLAHLLFDYFGYKFGYKK